VFVAAGVTLTFRPASGACADTSLEKSVDELAIPAELPGKNSSRQATRVGAILVQPDALPQRVDVLFTEASVDTTGAGELALDANLDAIFEQTPVYHTVRSGRQHLLYRAHGFSLTSTLPIAPPHATSNGALLCKKRLTYWLELKPF
jgi:hypothetical protein